jgi:hypothetical protein
MARDALAVLLEVAPESFAIEVEVELPAEWAAATQEVRDTRAAADLAERAAGATARDVARRLSADGLSVRDVGHLLGVSHQRVSQLIAAPLVDAVAARRELVAAVIDGLGGAGPQQAEPSKGA